MSLIRNGDSRIEFDGGNIGSDGRTIIGSKVFMCHETVDGEVSTRERRIWSSSGMERESTRGRHDDGGLSKRMILIM